MTAPVLHVSPKLFASLLESVFRFQVDPNPAVIRGVRIAIGLAAAGLSEGAWTENIDQRVLDLIGTPHCPEVKVVVDHD